jgi:hypothetical protein
MVDERLVSKMAASNFDGISIPVLCIEIIFSVPDNSPPAKFQFHMVSY